MNSENYETNAATIERDPRGANAQRHGILSEHVPPAERAAYLAHVEAVRDSSGARGYLQERLAERAALALWRLDRLARYEAALCNSEQRSVTQGLAERREYGHAGNILKAFNRVHRMVGESVEHIRADPALAEHWAVMLEASAAQLDGLAQGGTGEGLSDDLAFVIGGLLTDYLGQVKISAADMVRAMLGKRGKPVEVDTLEGGDWEYDPGEIPGLVRLWWEVLPQLGRVMLEGLASGQRRKAREVRAALLEAQRVEADAYALAAMPDGDALAKVTRYEAHLERVLYRALHDLEAARRQGEGLDTPGPLRGIVDAGERDA
ncbi:hypothetical protein [Deinococcus sp. RM]|uniref:hypothetical protein n=1 Tax=Deinococcus sp. RM TaxID=2316359 RepID=UPI000E6A3C41|nr:hypothetical protein [Deinococcus sp. RM]RIY03995.1 hypothetical protein D3W47_12670 [Deinococcus sp. RM]